MPLIFHFNSLLFRLFRILNSFILCDNFSEFINIHIRAKLLNKLLVQSWRFNYKLHFTHLLCPQMRCCHRPRLNFILQPQLHLEIFLTLLQPTNRKLVRQTRNLHIIHPPDLRVTVSFLLLPVQFYLLLAVYNSFNHFLSDLCL